MNEPSPIEQVAEAERIRRLMAAYCHRIDDGDFDGWAALFAQDAVLTIGRSEYAGRAAIREWAETSMAAAEEATRHIVANLEIDVDGEAATAVSDWLVVSASMAVLLAGRYDDRLVRHDGTWSFAERRISFFRPPRS